MFGEYMTYIKPENRREANLSADDSQTHVTSATSCARCKFSIATRCVFVVFAWLADVDELVIVVIEAFLLYDESAPIVELFYSV